MYRKIRQNISHRLLLFLNAKYKPIFKNSYKKTFKKEAKKFYIKNTLYPLNQVFFVLFPFLKYICWYITKNYIYL